MTLADERRFVTFDRGHVRDRIMLATMRNSLRGRTNPDTGLTFTEDEIAIVTQDGSRFYMEADGIDLFGQASQQRALWFATQIDPKQASSEFLQEYHGKLWLDPIAQEKLPAIGGSGTVTATGTVGTTYIGSTLIGDPAAQVLRDTAGKRYQVLYTAVIPAIGSVVVSVQGVDTGNDTNPDAGTVFRWSAAPIGSDPEASALTDFSGGFPQETDAQYMKRICDRIKYKPGAGNSAQVREWAKQSSVAVETAFVYPTAFHAGSTLVVIVQRRGTATGPLARIPSVGTLAAATGYLVPPTSPVVPPGACHMVIAGPVSVPSHLALQLTMRAGSLSGWKDAHPWPSWTTAYEAGVAVTSVISTTQFRVMTDVAPLVLPATGTDAPKLMVWDATTSRFEELNVTSVVLAAPSTYTVTLSSAPEHVIVTGDIVSPANGRAIVLAETVEAYFDEFGTGEALAYTDPRFVCAARFPSPADESPIVAGQTIVTRVNEQLGGAVSNANLSYISVSTPSVPLIGILVNGTQMLTLGRLGIYSY